MDRKDIPNLIGKYVVTQNLKATEWNELYGLVVRWNEERERFVVKLDRDGSVKLFKPFNLSYVSIIQNEKEEKLENLITTEQLIDFEHGMDLFDQLGSSSKYMHTWLKLEWLGNWCQCQAQQDKRYIPKIQAALENIIETSQFDDLVVSAKIQLALLVSWTENIELMTDLCMSCVGAHYGRLPELFQFLCVTMQDNFEVVKDIYFQSKRMIKNKTYINHGLTNFIEASTEFLDFCKDHDSSVNTTEECIFLRKTLESYESLIGNYSLVMGQVCRLEGNYEEAIRNVQIYQEVISSGKGNVDMISKCYAIKVLCYIQLGNKRMAKKVLQKLKRFRKHAGVNENIVIFENAIKKMSNTTSTTQVEENQSVRTKTQCSAYECKKVEPHVGTFKHCGRCRLKYYCSIKCQKKHWENGHKEECQEFEN